MNGQFLPRKNPAKTVKGRGFLDRGFMKILVAFCVCGTYYVIVKAKFRCYENKKRIIGGDYSSLIIFRSGCALEQVL